MTFMPSKISMSNLDLRKGINRPPVIFQTGAALWDFYVPISIVQCLKYCSSFKTFFAMVDYSITGSYMLVFSLLGFAVDWTVDGRHCPL